MNKDEYNGWTNRETWALNLWLTNEEGIYNETLRVLREAHKEDVKNKTNNIYKQDALRDFVEDLREEQKDNKQLISMFQDVGSLWRINWGEVVDAFKEDFAIKEVV